MMEEQGLAARGVNRQPAMDGSGQGQQMVQQVAQMLASGISPEELMQKGVPQEVIQAAIAMLEQQAAQQTQVPPEQAGLAGRATQGGL